MKSISHNKSSASNDPEIDPRSKSHSNSIGESRRFIFSRLTASMRTVLSRALYYPRLHCPRRVGCTTFWCHLDPMDSYICQYDMEWWFIMSPVSGIVSKKVVRPWLSSEIKGFEWSIDELEWYHIGLLKNGYHMGSNLFEIASWIISTWAHCSYFDIPSRQWQQACSLWSQSWCGIIPGH